LVCGGGSEFNGGFQTNVSALIFYFLAGSFAAALLKTNLEYWQKAKTNINTGDFRRRWLA
jgi:hypothetical protein